MKKHYLPLLAVLIASFGANAQMSSDDPSFNHPPSVPITVVPDYSVEKVLSTSVIAPCNPGNATFVATEVCGGYVWSSDSAGLNVVGNADTLITGTLTTDTSFFISTTTAVAGTDTNMTLPPHGSVYSGNVRGYYFKSPIDFKITALRVPTEASTGTQNIGIIRFNEDSVYNYPILTNNFVDLGYWANYAGDTIYTCIHVAAGDIIGIFGNRADQNSYATAPFLTDIAGIPVTLTRAGMQLPISSNPLSDVFSETGGSLSRVEMFYTTTFDTTSTTQIDVTLLQPYSDITNIDICSGDSALISGNYYSADTIFTDSLVMISGCDSLISTLLTVHVPVFGSDSAIICPGDSALVNGAYYTTPVVVIDTIASSFGCDSIVTTNITLDACVGIHELVNDLASVYPNPATDKLTLDFADKQIEFVRITDALGRTMANYNNVSGLITVDISNYASGVYFVIVRNGNKYQSQKIVKK